MNWINKSLVILALVMGSGRAVAEAPDFSIGGMIEWSKQTGDTGMVVDMYLSGFAQALTWSQAYNVAVFDNNRMFCFPAQITLSPDILIDIAETYVEENPDHADKEFGAHILMALVQQFPCRE